MLDIFGLFGIVFFLIFGFVFVSIFRTITRAHRLQNKMFDAAERKLDDPRQAREAAPPGDYRCDQCGAVLESGIDVSPSGDFKCHYCGKWSNVHT